MRAVMVIGLILLTGFSFSGCANVDRSVRIDTDASNSFAVGQYRDNRTGVEAHRRWGESDPVHFARAIAIINYSKHLRNIKYNECGGVIAYEFEPMPASSMRSAYPAPGTQRRLPSSFGHQPVE
jgi:hypothetical protein